MQYTEAHYTELYNSLPKGLRDLVLSGQLAIHAGSLGMKYKISKDEVSSLETSIEDVCLGLVTVEELPEHISFELGVDSELGESLAQEVLKGVLADHEEEIQLMRKYKLELDERIRDEEERNSSDPLKAKPVNTAKNILNLTKEEEKQPLTQQLLRKTSNNNADEKDAKVAAWYTGDNSPINKINITNTSADRQSNLVQSDLSKTSGRSTENNSQIKTRPSDGETQKVSFTPKSNLSFNDLVAEKVLPVQQLVQTQPQQVVVQQVPTDKTMTKVEQQIFNLTQAVNRLVDNNSQNQGNQNTSKVSDNHMYDELMKRIDLMTHRLDDLQKKYIESQAKLHTFESGKSSAGEHVNSYEPEVKKDADQKSLDFLAKTFSTKTETPETEIRQPVIASEKVVEVKKPEAEQVVKSETISSKALDAILKTRLENEQKSAVKPPEPQTKTVLSVDELFSTPNTKIDITKTEEAPKVEIPKNDVLSDLLADVNFINDIESKKESDLQMASTVKNLEEELIIKTEEDKMKTLQEKIRSLNKGISYGGVASIGNAHTDPHNN